MSKTTKFLVVVSDNTELIYGYFSKDIRKKIQNPDNDFPQIRVVECKHEKLEDNFVEIEDECKEEHSFLRDAEGDLWYIEDVMTKEEVINAFE